MLTRAFLHEGTWSSFRQRNHGAPVDTGRIPGHRFVVYLQNHDQIGNRATGDRLTQTLSPGLLGLRGGARVHARRSRRCCSWARSGARAPRGSSSPTSPTRACATRCARGAPPSSPSTAGGTPPCPTRTPSPTFHDSKLDWSEREQEPHATLLRLHRELIALRKTWPELTDPWLDEVEVAVDDEARTVVVHRGKLRVVCNLADEPASVPVGPIARILLASEPVEGQGGELKLPPESFAIYLASSE